LPPQTFSSLKIPPKCTAFPRPPSWIRGRGGEGKGGKGKGGRESRGGKEPQN